MSDYRESCIERQAVRRGIVEPRPVGGKRRQDKPVVVECRYPVSGLPMLRGWWKFGSYATTEIAEQTMARQRRKHPSAEYRIRPQGGSAA